MSKRGDRRRAIASARSSESSGAQFQIAAVQNNTFHAGILPPAVELQRIEAVLPGSVERILRMAEANPVHRLAIERIVIDGNVRAQMRGPWFAFFLAVVVMAVGFWAIVSGRTTVGATLMLGTIAALATAFLGARLSQRNERNERNERTKKST